MSIMSGVRGDPAPDPVVRAGRDCPLDYRLGANLFTDTPVLAADVLYLAGGLYGNPFALEVIEHMLAAESGAVKTLCLNGDFHWFDARADWFAQIERASAVHQRLRGNVETEISRGGDTSAGCGCAYPDSVGDDDVARSNAIMRQLALAARDAVSAECVAMLGRLPAVGRYQIAEAVIGVTHGDDQSLAGWTFAHDQMASTWALGLADRMANMQLDLFASSHTCLPLASSAVSNAAGKTSLPVAVINNGSAGMANFSGTSYGLITRVAPLSSGPPPVAALYQATLGSVCVSALPVHFDTARWLSLFDSVWHDGSPAALSYRHRIANGPNYTLAQAQHGLFSDEMELAA